MQHISLDRTSRITTYKEFFCTKERGSGYLDVLSLYIVHVRTVNTEHPRKNENKRLKEGQRMTKYIDISKTNRQWPEEKEEKEMEK